MKTAYFDCYCGISGDMTLGALIDAGLEYKVWLAEVEKLGLTGYAVSKRKVKRAGLSGTKLTIKVNKKQPHRNLSDIEKLISKSKISRAAKAGTLKIFKRLASAEAKAHGTAIGKVHFHEVGAVDAIIDIAGSVIALEMMGIGRVFSSPLNLGSGTVKFSHGTLPVPAPATAGLVRGFPAYASDIRHELTTPTGAAIITTVAEDFGPMRTMRADMVGYGAGDKELPDMPNMLRVFIGEDADGYDEDGVELIETNIDDMDPRLYGHVMEMLFESGALDVWMTQVVMKKSRPGVKLSVLADSDKTGALVDIILSETTSFGVRISAAQRKKLAREIVRVKTKYGTLRVKVGRAGGKVIKAVPEYEDVKKLAKKTGIPAREIIEAAVCLFRE